MSEGLPTADAARRYDQATPAWDIILRDDLRYELSDVTTSAVSVDMGAPPKQAAT
jgi:hypothetical protein